MFIRGRTLLPPPPASGRSYFTFRIVHPPPFVSFPGWPRADEIPRHETAGTFVRPKVLEVFSISGQRPPRFRFYTPATYSHCQTIPTENHSLFRLRRRGQGRSASVIHVEILSTFNILWTRIYWCMTLRVCVTWRVRKHRGESE